MNKLYDRIDWHNNTTPAINETNLNKMSKALDDLDDRVVLIAGNILVTVPQLQEMLEDCTELEQRLEAMTGNPPYIGENGHWYTWDTDTGTYVDSGIDASITVQIADITMLEPGATPYVTNTGTDTDPIFHLFIPRGQPGKGISSITKTGTSGYVDTYTITYTDNTSTTYTVTNGRNTDQVSTIPTASASLVGTIYQYIGASTSSYTHGFYYECVNDGGVYKWVNIPVGNDPVAVDSTDPYTYRQSKGNLADMEIVGASVGWNQLVQNGNFTSTNEWSCEDGTLSVNNNICTVTITSISSNQQGPYTVVPRKKDHVYLMSHSLKFGIANVSCDVKIGNASTNITGVINSGAANSWKRYEYIIKGTSTIDRVSAEIDIDVRSGFQIGDTYQLEKSNIYDLTQLFNPTVADAIYAMEQATVGAGVAFFRKYFPKDYYAYDAGSVQSVCVGSRKVVGKNLVESKISGVTIGTEGKIKTSSGYSVSIAKVIEGETYIVSTDDSRGFVGAFFKDLPVLGSVSYNDTRSVIANKVFTAPISGYVAFLTTDGYAFSQCEFGTTATPYEPYTSTAYPFDSTKELRGKFDLVNGELKASGDVWRGDEIQRKYVIIDLGIKTWTRVASSASGIYYFYFDGDSTIKTQGNNGVVWPNLLTPKYSNTTSSSIAQGTAPDKSFGGYDGHGIRVRDDAYTDAATFKTAMSGVYLVYELATPTTESAQPYQNPQRAYIDGTEEFTDGLTRDVMVPVGNSTTYQQDKILPSVEDYVDAVADKSGGGHTILNGSGSAMTQRGKLQFVGADVTDDGANDKTIVTTTPQSMIGDAWVDSHAYAVGDYCIDGNVLYKCKTAHTSSASNRPPYASYWDAVTVSSQLKNSEYSTTEHIVGTWVDGSPLYEQTVEYTPNFLSTDYNKMVEKAITTLPASYKVWSCEIRITWDSERYCIILPYTDYNNSGSLVTALNWYYGGTDPNNNLLYLRAYFTSDPTTFNKKLYATLRYTK